MVEEFVQRLVPDGLWELAEPLIPRQWCAGRRRDPAMTVAAVVFVLTSGSAWRHLPPVFAVLSDRAGLPLAVAVSAANTHDSQALPPLVQAVPAIRSRCGPRRRRPAKLPADTGYDYPNLRRWLHQRGITPRIARRGVHSSTRLGRHRWRIEPLLAHLFGYRRLATRDERRANLYCGLLTLAAALTCYKRLAT